MSLYNDLDDDAKIHAHKHLSRTYGKGADEYICNNKLLNEYDMKMIHTIQKLKASYKKYDKCAKTEMLSRHEIDCMTVSYNQPVVKKKTKQNKAVVETKVKICPAIKMNGQVCNCKIKNGNMFCARHSKK